MSKGRKIMHEAQRARMGFLTSEEVAQIAADPETRLDGLLVRCGGGRFLAPAQDVAHFIGIIERHSDLVELHTAEPERVDYVRDVSVPARSLSFDPLKGVC